MRRALLVAAAVALLVLPAMPAALAQPSGSLDVRFLAVSPWTEPGRDLSVAVRATNTGEFPMEELSFRLSVYGRVTSRSALRAALDGRPGALVAATTEEVPGALGSGQHRRVEITRDLAELAASFRGPGARSGVYPVEVAAVLQGRVLDRWFTAVPFFAIPPPARLNLAWVWTPHRPPAITAAGTVDAAGLEQTVRRIGLVHSGAALAARPSAAVTLAPSGVLLDQIRAATGRDEGPPVVPSPEAETTAPAPASPSPTVAASKAPEPTPDASTPSPSPSPEPRSLLDETLDNLIGAGAAPAVEVAAQPYARADLPSLYATGLGDDVAAQITRGRAAVAAGLGVEPSPTLLVPSAFRLDAESAATAARLGTTRVVLDPALLPPVEDPALEGALFGPSRPVLVDAGGGVRLEALLPDPDIRARLERGGDPVLLAQAVVAETASSFHELPLLAGARLLVIASDTLPHSATVSRLLSALHLAPWITMRTASDALETLPPEGEPLPLLDPATVPEVPDVLGARALAAARGASELAGRLGDLVSGEAAPLDELRRLILVAESADWEADPESGEDVARAARRRAQGILDEVRVPDRAVTLTSRTGSVPVTVLNETELPLRVRVTLESAKVNFPEGRTRLVTLDGRVTTLVFPIEARAAGSFPIVVQLQTPQGGEVIGTSRIVVRSTAVGAVTLALTGGAALFLVGAGIRRTRRRRRERAEKTA